MKWVELSSMLTFLKFWHLFSVLCPFFYFTADCNILACLWNYASMCILLCLHMRVDHGDMCILLLEYLDLQKAWCCCVCWIKSSHALLSISVSIPHLRKAKSHSLLLQFLSSIRIHRQADECAHKVKPLQHSKILFIVPSECSSTPLAFWTMRELHELQ